ncbi:4-hydroxyphenylpyruvate dioxygenase [Methylocystis sp. MJC1]|uniref:4-hydroxyphenylpyruvate dioxygenase n=2 Tax=Methylocystis sp. MJC1 TaxID=2654282 RepID=UPI0013ED5B08|nr:4-hydroxyphenylpyruvate dioxygenase [Methylocystis sp. MJC1]MBU6528386.1 4-hydroxyphenylpyruvate dioxygenase [Methylocystis sp. MJC1]
MAPLARNEESEPLPGDNPMGTDGFEFVEYAHPDPAALAALFQTMGFSALARHRSKDVTLFRQGDINYVLNAEPDSFGAAFARSHGPSVCAIGFRVRDASHALRRAASLGAKVIPTHPGPMELHIPAIEGVGGALIYLVDRYGASGSIWDVDFRWTGAAEPRPEGVGLLVIDHLTHNVRRGRMDELADWYVRIFNFRQIRYFDIEGRFTGLHSRAMTSPCGKIRIPINESADETSQIEEFLHAYKGEGVQHVACLCRDIYTTVEKLRERGLEFMPAPPDAYYEAIEKRLPRHGEPIERLRRMGILIDGVAESEGGAPRLLLQIFSKTVIGPIFFEFIERKGDEGFGEGNFRALFESIEEDQLRRGALKPAE